MKGSKLRQGGLYYFCPFCNVAGWQRHERGSFLRHVLKRHGQDIDPEKCTSPQEADLARKKVGGVA